MLSILVLCSTMSITVEKHFCGGTLVDVALFSEAKGCGMEMTSESQMKKPCCKNEVEIIQGQDELKVTPFQGLDLEQQLFVFSFTYSYLERFENRQDNSAFIEYPPPLIVRQLYKLDEAYLI
ncbi:hypothetical protein J1C55_05260 [Winogradskyella sp. E313]|uniref:Uncharacterized protein n=2 Tax=Winogradskyella immobilis TaxID=2816852 RepID=A0ABS8ELU9_9FLAO|nr:hypothetical protein [Winogradskyella immobilis]